MVSELWVARIIQALPAGGAESSRGLLGPRFVWMVSSVAGAKENFSSCQPFQTAVIFSAIPLALFSYKLHCFTAFASGPGLSSQVLCHMPPLSPLLLPRCYSLLKCRWKPDQPLAQRGLAQTAVSKKNKLDEADSCNGAYKENYIAVGFWGVKGPSGRGCKGPGANWSPKETGTMRRLQLCRRKGQREIEGCQMEMREARTQRSRYRCQVNNITLEKSLRIPASRLPKAAFDPVPEGLWAES